MASVSSIGAPATADARLDDNKLFTRVMWRILPLIVIAYFLAYLDRTNIAFAQLQMNTDLGFSAAIYGFGAGVFFISYCLFEVPSNLVLARIGARTALFTYLLLWGLTATATAFVTTPMQFYVARFLLGVFEAGIFPGAVYYLGLWLPAKRRAEGVAFFLMASIVSGIIGGPISGWIMTAFDSAGGWRGWHWLLILEGLPSSIFAFVVYFTLSDSPSAARWLSAAERAHVSGILEAEDKAAKGASQSHTFLKALADPKLYVVSAAGFMALCSVYAIMFWIPQMIRNAGVDNLFHVGLYAMVPHTITMITMYIVGRHSDRTAERRWHFAVMVVIGAAGLMLCTVIPGNLPLTLLGLTISEAALNSVLPLFWTIARGVLTRSASAGGLGFVGTIANFGGFVAPSIIGYVQTATGSLSYGLRTVAIITLLGAVVMLFGVRKEAMAAESVKS